MKLIVLITAALWSGLALAQTSDAEMRNLAKLIDIQKCTPSNPNCRCNPKVETCWFKVGDKEIYFDALTRERSTLQKFNMQ